MKCFYTALTAFASTVLAFAALAHAQQGYIHGQGDPRVITPTPNCGQSRFYIDDSNNQMYTAAQGSPCLWTIGTSGSLPIATTTVLGGVKPDGTSCSVNGSTGVLKCTGAPPASPTGAIQINAGAGAFGTLPGGTAGTIPYNAVETPVGGVQGVASYALPGVPGRAVANSSDTITEADRGSVVAYNFATAIAVTLDSAASIGSNFDFATVNFGAGNVTFTPTAGLINGAATLVLTQHQNCVISSSDNVNYTALCSPGQSGGGGGSPCTSTANALQLNNSGSFGCALAVDNGSYLNYTGAGGIYGSANGGQIGLLPTAVGARLTTNGFFEFYGRNDSAGDLSITNGGNAVVLSGEYDGGTGIGHTIYIVGGAWGGGNTAGSVVLRGGIDATVGRVLLQTPTGATAMVVGANAIQGAGTAYSAAGTAIPACAAATLGRAEVSDATVATPGSAYASGGTYTIAVQCIFNSSGSVYSWIID